MEFDEIGNVIVPVVDDAGGFWAGGMVVVEEGDGGEGEGGELGMAVAVPVTGFVAK